jgi:hypothetical protein
MENNEKDKHLDIETVTPETDDGQPNDQRHNHRIKNEVGNANEQIEEKKGESADAKPEKDDEKAEVEDQETEDQENDHDTDNGADGDASDIETVSP